MHLVFPLCKFAARSSHSAFCYRLIFKQKYSSTPLPPAQQIADMSKQVTLKHPKGTNDYFGPEFALREDIFNKITTVFKRHGAAGLDTPVFELTKLLRNKYGEDGSQLIYDLQDQGGEECSLRYDLTIPFARYLAMNKDKNLVKRYQIAKVYRRDQPQIAKGRHREFYQCDFDIAGPAKRGGAAAGDGSETYSIYDSEILYIICEVFAELGLHMTIKLNHRKILDGIFKVAGVPLDKIRTVSSSVDKLDKASWDEVRQEMVDQKGIAPEVVDLIGGYCYNKRGTIAQMIDEMQANSKLMENEDIKAGINDMKALAAYLEAYGISSHIIFDFSLARGLDYYTGVIYEVVYKPRPTETSEITSSIAAGGRYDHLISNLVQKRDMPCVGISFGVERIYAILEARRKAAAKAEAPKEPGIYVMAFGGKGFTGLLPERMALASEFWQAGLRAEFTAKAKSKLGAQFDAADDLNLAVGAILGEDEIKNGQVRLKRLGLPDDHPEKDGRLVLKATVVEEAKRLLQEIKDEEVEKRERRWLTGY